MCKTLTFILLSLAACVNMAHAQTPTTTSLETLATTKTTTLAVTTATATAVASAPAVEDSATTRAYNLAHAKWYASADLPASADASQVLARATPTTPIVSLRTNPGGFGTLYTLLDIAQPPGSGAEVVIGDIDGYDTTYFNGTQIGHTTGYGVTDSGISRVYYVDPKLIKPGKNVLAVRITGVWGRGTFGLKREPLTFGFVDSAPVSSVYITPKPALGVTAIAKQEALKAIRRVAGDSLTSFPAMRKRASFGRFGEFFNDGLPAVTEVTPTSIVNRDGPQFSVAMDTLKEVSIATGDNEPGIDGWHKLSRVIGRRVGHDTAYTMLQHVFYPGAVITLEQGPMLQLRVKFPHNNGAIQSLSDQEIAAVTSNTAEASFGAFAFYEPVANTCPAVVAVSGVAANIVRAGNHFDVTFSRGESSKAPAKIYIFYPRGLDRVDLSSKPASFLDLAGSIDHSQTSESTVRHWLRLGLHAPAAADEYFQVLEQRGRVRIFQLARYEAPAGLELGGPLLCPPPQVLFARDTYKYPVEVPPTTSTGVLAFSGELQALIKTTTASRETSPPLPGEVTVLSYELPIPPMEDRGLLAVPETENLKSLLNETLTDIATTSSMCAVDSLYKGRTQGFQAFSYLTPENRKMLLDNSALVVPASLKEPAWFEHVEPFSGLHFWWTYFIEGPYFDRYDQDWGNGLSLYGLYTYAKYAGAWELVANNWDAVERMFSWFTVTDDWEWMRASNGQHGHGTGAGDCESATYAAAISYARMARNTGRDDDYRFGLYKASRAALLALNRFAYDPFARQNDFKEDKSMVLGFHEGRGFLVGELDRYPWNVTSNISGNGVQPENFTLYLKYAPELLRQYEHDFEAAYPQWADGKYEYAFPTLYKNNSGYISLPHIYLRARLALDSVDILSSHLMSARSNKAFWWLAPPVVAEVINRKAATLFTDWGRCAFLGGTVTLDGKRRTVEAQFSNNFPPDMVELELPRAPSEFQINAGPVPLTDSKYENGRLQLRLRRPGLNTVTVRY